jgi:lysophospholipase L1-like esterase
MFNFRSIAIFALFLCALVSGAQTVTVTGSHLGGPFPVTGTITFQPILGDGTQGSAMLSGGGQMSRQSLTAPVTAGAFSLPFVVDTNLSAPKHLCYSVTARSQSGLQVLGEGYSCVQPQRDSYWCIAGTCNFDNYAPSAPAIGVYGSNGFTGLHIAYPVGTSDYTAAVGDDVIVAPGPGNVFLTNSGDGVGRIRTVLNTSTGGSFNVGLSGGGVFELQAGRSMTAILTSSGWTPYSDLGTYQQVNAASYQILGNQKFIAYQGPLGGRLTYPSTALRGATLTIYNYGANPVLLFNGATQDRVVPPGTAVTLGGLGGSIWALLSATAGSSVAPPPPTLSQIGGLTDYLNFGDSIGQATGATETAKGFSQRLAILFGGQYTNAAAGGDTANDMSQRVYATYSNTYEQLPAVTMFIGHNDVNFLGSGPNALAQHSAALMASIAHIAMPPQFKVFGVAATRTGSFAPNTSLPSTVGGAGVANTMAVTGTANGDTVSWSLTTTNTNQAVYVAYLGMTSNAGAASLSIDSAVVDTITTAPPGGTVLSVNNPGTATAVYAKRYVIASAGAHALTLKITSPTASGNSFTFLWSGTTTAAGMAGVQPRLYVMDPVYQAGFNLMSTTDAYINAQTAVISQLQADGLPIIHLPTNSYVDNAHGMSTINTVAGDGSFIPSSTVGGLHPNDYGHAQIATMVASNAVPSTVVSSAVMSHARRIAQGTGTLGVNRGDQVVFLSGFTGATLPTVGFEEQEHMLYNYGSTTIAVTGQGGSWTLAPGASAHFVNGGSGWYRF